jgi:hypothetical protein
MKTKTSVLTTIILSFFLFTSCNLLPDSWVDAISGASKLMKQDGNSLFHQTDEVSLIIGELLIEGEVKDPGKVDLNDFYKREVFIKESFYDEETGINFIGAYRYKGYSLFDLLHPYNQNKKNMEAFKPAIDLYVVIESSTGEKTVFSWSEIFHTNNPHQILIATEMAPIVPYRKEVDYSMGDKWRVVAANDLFAYRMLEDPVKISVYSFDRKEYEINKDMDPKYSESVNVVLNSEIILNIPQIQDESSYVRYYSSFYGMGMGHHKAAYFEGPSLPKLLEKHINQFDREHIRHGLVCFAGIDGYRAIYSFSELFNRVDQVVPILSIAPEPMNGGFYRVFHPTEFYADRSVKCLSEIYFFRH